MRESEQQRRSSAATPRFQRFRCSAADELNVPLRCVDAEIIQQSPGVGTWVVEELVVPGVRLQRGSMGADAITNGAAPAGTHCFLWADHSQRRCACNGTSLSPGTLAIGGPGTPSYGAFDSGAGFTLISITDEELQGRIDALAIDVRFPTRGQFRADCIEHRIFHQLQEMVRARFIALEQGLDTAAHPGVNRLLDPIVETVLLGLAAQHGAPKAPPHSTAGRQARTMRLLSEYLRAHRDCLLSLQDLCVIAETGARNLQYTFQKQLGITPTQFLRLRQLHQARRRLMDPSTPSVKYAALNSGFWELGRFSVTYRTLFGESPSDTLLRGRRMGKPKGCLRKIIALPDDTSSFP